MRQRLVGLCLLAYPRALRSARRRRAGRVRRAATVLAVGMGTALVALTWSATAQPTRVEEDVLSCMADCRVVEAEVAARVRDGWTCDETRASGSVTWRCARD